jgi:hypothetical protein
LVKNPIKVDDPSPEKQSPFKLASDDDESPERIQPHQENQMMNDGGQPLQINQT